MFDIDHAATTNSNTYGWWMVSPACEIAARLLPTIAGSMDPRPIEAAALGVTISRRFGLTIAVSGRPPYADELIAEAVCGMPHPQFFETQRIAEIVAATIDSIYDVWEDKWDVPDDYTPRMWDRIGTAQSFGAFIGDGTHVALLDDPELMPLAVAAARRITIADTWPAFARLAALATVLSGHAAWLAALAVTEDRAYRGLPETVRHVNETLAKLDPRRSEQR